MNKINKFLWWCAGANISILEKCPTDHSKYFGIGGTILFTALMASFAGGYAFYTAFDNTILALCFGIFWGLLIFNLDRYIVSSAGKGDGTVKITKEEFSNALPRLVLAIFIGAVIATPLELKIFEREINVEIDEIKNEKRQEIKAGLQDLRNEIAGKKNKKIELEDRLEKISLAMVGGDPIIGLTDKGLEEVNQSLKQTKSDFAPVNKNYLEGRSRYYRYKKILTDYEETDEYVAESDIKLAKKKMEQGRRQRSKYQKRYNLLKNEIEKLEKQKQSLTGEKIERTGTLKEDYVALQKKAQLEFDEIDKDINDLEDRLGRKEKEADDTATQFEGLMARLIALDRLSVDKDTVYNNIPVLKSTVGTLSTDTLETAVLSQGSTARNYTINEDWTPVFYAKWMITILLICIEITPILFKMMTESGPYDDRLEEVRYASEVTKKKFISDLNEQINTELKLTNALNQNKIEAEMKANKELMDSIALAQAEIAAIAINEWKAKKMLEVEIDPESIVREKLI